MRIFKEGQKVIIVDTIHSWAVSEMENMVGTVHKIDYINSGNDSYRIGMYTWHWRDLKAFKGKILKIKPATFDPGKLW